MDKASAGHSIHAFIALHPTSGSAYHPEQAPAQQPTNVQSNRSLPRCHHHPLVGKVADVARPAPCAALAVIPAAALVGAVNHLRAERFSPSRMATRYTQSNEHNGRDDNSACCVRIPHRTRLQTVAQQRELSTEQLTHSAHARIVPSTCHPMSSTPAHLPSSCCHGCHGRQLQCCHDNCQQHHHASGRQACCVSKHQRQPRAPTLCRPRQTRPSHAAKPTHLLP